VCTPLRQISAEPPNPHQFIRLVVNPVKWQMKPLPLGEPPELKHQQFLELINPDAKGIRFKTSRHFHTMGD
jgi:hypothetical protein